jgi:hypothetical protein
MCFFSPIGFKKPIENIKYNIEKLNESQIPYLVIELLYPNQTQNISNSIIVKSNTIIFSKENLWNIAEKFVPEHFTKIIFLDSDILFNKPDWFDLASELLNTNQIIQPIEYAYRDITIDMLLNNNNIDVDLLNTKICKQAVTKAVKNNETIDLSKYEPGFSVGMQRSFFKNIGGFFEHGITGSSDSMFWLSIVDFVTAEPKKLLENRPDIKYKFLLYQNKILQYLDLSKIDYLKDCVGLHLYHGTKPNRFYETRNSYLPDSFDVYYNEYGVLEIESHDLNRKDMKQYWIDRKEDE